MLRELYGEEGVSVVALEPSLRPGIWNVLAVATWDEFRDLGLASVLMREACLDADEEGVELWLTPTPVDGQEHLEDLKRFYARLGFADRGMYMIRAPLGSEHATLRVAADGCWDGGA